MPWLDALNDPEDLRRCIRDLVALSTLSAIWRTYAPKQIAEDVAAALLSTLGSDFLYIALPGNRNEQGIEVIRTGTQFTDDDGTKIRNAVVKAILTGGQTQPVIHNSSLSKGPFYLATAPIGFGGDAIAVAGSRNGTFPTESQKLLLGIGANEATLALQRWQAETNELSFATLIENSSDFVGTANLNGSPQYINAAGRLLLGLEPSRNIHTLHILDFVDPQLRERVGNEIWPLVMGGRRWVGELELRHFKTGAAIPFLVDWFRIDDPRNGQPMNIATVNRDLTAQKAAEASLRDLNASLEARVTERTGELAESNQKLFAEIVERERTAVRLHEAQLELFHSARLSTAGQLATALAHELNQPLTAAANSVYAARRMLASGAINSSDRAQEALNDAGEQVLRAGQLIHRLRDFVSRGKAEMQVENVATMIKEASTLAFIGSRALGTKVYLRLDPDAGFALANRIQIQQVLGNLIRNAFDAMADSPERGMEVWSRRLPDDSVEIGVADTGCGVPEEIVRTLFDPFVSTKTHGMGLGLSICKSIVEAHGGGLTSEPNSPRGTIFRFTLNGVPNKAKVANA